MDGDRPHVNRARREGALTGRSLVVFAGPISQARFQEFLSDLQRSRTFDREDRASLFLSRFGSARVPAEPDEIDASLRAKYEIVAVDPERVVSVHPIVTPEREFRLNPLNEMGIAADLKWTGEGIRVAILDSGLECDHPEFRGRRIIRDSAVSALDSCDRNGHGTHCTGLVAGRRVPFGNNPAYGAAPGVSIIVIRALGDDLLGDDGDILKAMSIAVLTFAADILVLCMGADVAPVAAFERDASGYKNNCLIIAAAGNDTSSTDVGLLQHPANAPSIMGVAAIDDNGGPWEYSAGSGRSDVVEVAAPGEGIFSSYYSRVKPYDRISGTSQAAAYAAGVAALWAHSNPTYRGEALRDALKRNAKYLGRPQLLGTGLVQAPR